MRRLLCRQILVALTLFGALAGACWPLFPWAAEYGDITFSRQSAGMDDIPPAVFPHWVHRMQYKCGACHNELIKMKAGANPVTMEGMLVGRWCGACHDGKTAFESNFDTCPRCHNK